MTNTIRVRRQAQAELRANIRTLLADRGMTQAELCRRSGIKPNHLTTCLAGNTWLSVRAVAEFAEVLEVDGQEILGGSIFKHQTTRYDEFEQKDLVHDGLAEPERQGMPEDEVPEDRHRALCCVCGTLRTFGERSNHYTPGTWGTGEYFGDGMSCHPPSYRRMVMDMDCRTCESVTAHAQLRDHRENRDVAEGAIGPSPAATATSELDVEIRRLSAFGIEFSRRNLNEGKDREKRGGYSIHTSWDKAKSHWRIEIDPVAPPRIVLQALATAWKKIASGGEDCDGWSFWGHRSDEELAWAQTADDLAEEIRRLDYVLKADTAREIAHKAFGVDQEGDR